MSNPRLSLPAGRPMRGLSASAPNALMISPARASAFSISWRCKWPTIRSRSSITPGVRRMRVTSSFQPAGHRPLHGLSSESGLETAARLLPSNAFSCFQEFGVAPLCLRMKVGALLGRIRFLGDRFQDEIVRRRARPLCRPRDAALQFVGQANGGGGRGALRICIRPRPMWHIRATHELPAPIYDIKACSRTRWISSRRRAASSNSRSCACLYMRDSSFLISAAAACASSTE